MAQTVNYIVAKTSPNLYAAAKQANLNQTQVNQIEQYSWTVDKNKNLLRMPVERAREQFNSLDKEVQDMLRFLYPDADYAKAAPDAGDKLLGLVKGGLKIAASPLIGIYKAAGTYGRAINVPYLMGRQAAQGEEFFSKQVFTDAWDGRRVFDEGALAEAEKSFGKDNVAIAKGLLQGKKPGEIIEGQGALTTEFLNSFSKAFNNDQEFKQVMDAVKYAQVSPGRDLARILNKPVSTKSGDYISGKTKNLSGFVDFMYQIVIDPLTWVTGGAAKLPGLAAKVNIGDQMVRNVERFGTLGVKKSFEESPALRNHWDKEIGPMIKRLGDSKNLAEEAQIIREIGTKYAGHEDTEWLQLLKRNRIYNADAAVKYFGDNTESAINLLAGRVEGTQYFRNGVATARNQRRLDFGMGRFVDGIFNPVMAREDVLKQGEDVWTKLNKLGDEGTNYVSPEVEDIQKFVKNMDWPGAQEMSKRLAKTIDPKLISDTDEDPALQAAQQQMQAMAQEMEGMAQMLENVNKSMEAQDLERKNFEADIKAYQAETQRISAVQAGMTPEQIQDIVMGTIAAALDTGDLVSGELQREPMEMPEMAPEMMPPEQQMAPEMMPPEQPVPPQGM